MSSGIPLTDDDRLPWLALIRSTAERVCKEEWEKHGGKMKSVDDGGIGRAGVVIACSALKKWYRDILRGDVSAIPPPIDDLVSHIHMWIALEADISHQNIPTQPPKCTSNNQLLQTS
jgi:gluconokinase